MTEIKCPVSTCQFPNSMRACFFNYANGCAQAIHVEKKFVDEELSRFHPTGWYGVVTINKRKHWWSLCRKHVVQVGGLLNEGDD